jgi:hypothetical protein
MWVFLVLYSFRYQIDVELFCVCFENFIFDILVFLFSYFLIAWFSSCNFCFSFSISVLFLWH